MFIHYICRVIKAMHSLKSMSIESDIKQIKFKSAYQKLAVNLMFTNSWLCASQASLLKQYDLTIQQYNVLRILRGQSPCPVKVNDIIERMMDKMSNASRLVDKLLVKKLVQRTACPSDRRAVDVVITQEGLSLLQLLDEEQKEWETQLFNLDEQEANQLSELLDKMRGSTAEQVSVEYESYFNQLTNQSI